MKTIKSSKDITTLEVGDEVVFGNLKYKVTQIYGYYLSLLNKDESNDKIFKNLNISKKDFIKNLGIETLPVSCDFPEVKSLEALTAIVSALYKEYEKQNELPKTWKEFCERNPIKEGECFITGISIIQTLSEDHNRDVSFDKNICTSKQEAEAFLALMQLRQLRKCYIGDWEPDWNNIHDYYCIIVCQQMLIIRQRNVVSHPLSFPTYKLAEQFLDNFRDLAEIAKPLL